MLIRLLGTLTQTRVGVARLHTLVWGPCGVNMSSFWENTVICMNGFYLNYYFWRLSLLFLGMIMLISKIGTLTQTRMGLGRVTFSSKGPMMSISIPYDKMQ